MRRHWWLVPVALGGTLPLLHAQQPPATPPRPLPPSVTGGTPAVPTPVRPASDTQAEATTAAPVAKFRDLTAFPPETGEALTGMKAGAGWLFNMHQANGRFILGLNPAVKTVLPYDNDLHQAFAAQALAEAARFTGEERYTARAAQAVLTLLTLTRPDPADATCRVPSVGCNGCAFAAVLAMAIYHLPAPDAKLLAQAEELCAFLRKQCQADGSVKVFLRPDDATKLDPEGAPIYPGLVVQAIAMNCRTRPDAAKLAVLTKAVAYYRKAFRDQPQPWMAATMIPGFVDFYLQANKDAAARDCVFEMADHLCACQLGAADVRMPPWAGGFKLGLAAPAGMEPGFASAAFAGALAHAAKLTRHVPDGARYQKYRQACVAGVAFTRRLQFSDENADHFEKGFRVRYVNGGVHLSPSDGTLRIDATGLAVSAYLAYLQSGAEQ